MSGSVSTSMAGIPRPPRVDLKPPPSWRLEAVVATERPRSPAVSPDGRMAVFIQDRDTSDLWLLDLDGGAPRRLTTGRDPQPYWEDTQPAFSPDGTAVAYCGRRLDLGGADRRRPTEARRRGRQSRVDRQRPARRLGRARPLRPPRRRLRRRGVATAARPRARRSRSARRRAGRDRLTRRRDRRLRLRPA